MDATKIQVEPMLDGQALCVTLNAPKGNVLDGVMMEELCALFDELRGRKELKLLCFTGAGDHFSFGASVPEHVRERAPAMLGVFHAMFRKLADLAIPTAAVVRGRCLGGGLELAMFCQWVVAHPDAKLGQPEIELGVLAPVASLVLPLKVGQPAADDLLVTGRIVAADEAHRMGLVTHVAEDPMGLVEQLARTHLVAKSASSLRMAVRAARWQLHRSLQDDLAAMERFYLEELMATHDANEGLASFLEKRRPAWKHE